MPPSSVRVSVEDYLRLPTNHLVEFTDGRLEYLTFPTEYHQLIVGSLTTLLSDFTTSRNLGVALFAPLPVRLHHGCYRTPDVLFMSRQNAARRHTRYWDGADLVMEVTLPSTRRRDLVQKRKEYADAGVPEYWIIDTERRAVRVFVLKEHKYLEASADVGRGLASSNLLKGFTLNVAKLFEDADAARSAGTSGR